MTQYPAGAGTPRSVGLHLALEVDGDSAPPAAWRYSGRALGSRRNLLIRRLVLELQDRGAYRTGYLGSTLRKRLDLPSVS